MTMYEDNARKVNAMLAALAPRHPPEIIAVGHIDAMLKIRARLDAGRLVGMLADRSFGDEAVLPVTFLGATAYLPIGPMRAAAMLRRRVMFMLGLYRGGNRYHVVFEAAGRLLGVRPRGKRQAAIEAAIDTLRGAARAVLPQRSLQLVQLLRFLAQRSSVARGGGEPPPRRGDRAARAAACCWRLPLPARQRCLAGPAPGSDAGAELDRLMSLAGAAPARRGGFQREEVSVDAQAPARIPRAC